MGIAVAVPVTRDVRVGGIGMMGLVSYWNLATTTNLNQYRWVNTGTSPSEMQLAASQPGISSYYTSAVLVAMLILALFHQIADRVYKVMSAAK